QPLFAISRRSHFSEAFDYALLFQTASTSKEVFLPDSLAVNSEELTATHFAVAVSRALDYAQFSREWSTKAKIFTKESLAARQAGHWVRQLTTHTTNRDGDPPGKRTTKKPPEGGSCIQRFAA
ncbi:hypothetical protein QTI51_27015, partial [Variovorax sp. J22G73]|uniref:hypothetical protein n=1 Tax=unclassified Variovorax TaxID=663243 RepID=UPI0025790C51